MSPDTDAQDRRTHEIDVEPLVHDSVYSPNVILALCERRRKEIAAMPIIDISN